MEKLFKCIAKMENYLKSDDGISLMIIYFSSIFFVIIGNIVILSMLKDGNIEISPRILFIVSFIESFLILIVAKKYIKWKIGDK